MTGLLLKDFICLKSQARILILCLVAYIICFTVMGNEGFVFGMIIILAVTLVMNTFAYDENAKWDNYALSLPITKQQIVISKYLLSLLLISGGIIICVIINLVKKQTSFEAWMTIYAPAGIAILTISIMLPFLYKFGTQKARLLIVIIILVPTFSALFLSKLGLTVPSESTIKLLITLSPFVLAAFFLGSYFISCNIVEKKEI